MSNDRQSDGIGDPAAAARRAVWRYQCALISLDIRLEYGAPDVGERADLTAAAKRLALMLMSQVLEPLRLAESALRESVIDVLKGMELPRRDIRMARRAAGIVLRELGRMESGARQERRPSASMVRVIDLTP